jgi:hypothetical protein
MEKKGCLSVLVMATAVMGCVASALAPWLVGALL